MHLEAARRRSDGDNAMTKNHELVREFAWAITSINVHFQEIRQFWAKALGISGPQWMIMMAVADLDKGEGVSVKTVSKMLYVDPSFVTTQSKMLEKRGLMRRRTSPDDARVVQMSLTDKADKHIASLAAQQEDLNDFIFAELGSREFGDLTKKLVQLKARLEKARLKVAVDF
jgi:MarR family transcriptional regulator, organic hydroperoxide resistance regulator